MPTPTTRFNLLRTCLNAEALESRDVPSPFYDLQRVVTISDGFTGFGNLPSINDSGTIAFVGITDKFNDKQASGSDGLPESGLWIAPAAGGIVNINPGLSDNNNRDYGQAVSISNNGLIGARDKLVTTQSEFRVRSWDSKQTNNFTIHGSTGLNSERPGEYAAFQNFTAINDQGDYAFIGQSADGDFRTLELHKGTQDSQKSIRLSTFPILGGGPVTRPQITDKGQVVARLPNNFITLYTDDAEQKAYATSADGFASTGVTTGPSPDVSADGRVVAFMGNRGKGNGVFLSYYTGDKRHIVRVAGESLDGWTGLDLNSPVRISGSLIRDRGLTVTFEGKHNLLGEGIYSSRVSFYSKRANNFLPGQIVETEVSGAVPVVRVGDSAGTFLTDSIIVNSTKLGGSNDAGRGELAIWADTSRGQTILRATPNQVVFLNFNPDVFRLGDVGGRTDANLALLKSVGIQNGWDKGFNLALESVGYNKDLNRLQELVEMQTQALFTDAKIRVKIVSDQPAAIPYTERLANGTTVKRGGFQTVQFGDHPTDDGKFLGVAAPVYPVGSGGFDFFNQAIDDIAVVFADRIAEDGAFTTPIAKRPLEVMARGMAAVAAHEIGHNFGLVHLRNSAVEELMNGGGSQDGEFEGPPASFTGLDDRVSGELQVGEVIENSAERLIFGAGGPRGEPGQPTAQALLDQHAKYFNSQRYQLGNLVARGVSAKALLVGIGNPFGHDTLPELVNLGTGDLNDLLMSPVPIGEGADLFILGSTDGTKVDIIGIPPANAGAETSLALSGMGILSDSRLRAVVGAAGPAFNLMQLTEAGPVMLGTVTLTGVSSLAVSTDTGPVASGSTLNLGVTNRGQGPITHTFTLTNSGTVALQLGAATLTGTGYTLTPPTQATLQSSESTTLTVTLSDQMTGTNLPGLLTIPSNSADGTVTIHLTGAVTNRPRVTGFTRLDNGTGPLRVAIDFSVALEASVANTLANYRIASDAVAEGLKLTNVSYSPTATGSSVEITGPDAASLVPGAYHVRLAGDMIRAATGELLAEGSSNVLVDVRFKNVPNANGTFDAFNAGVVIGAAPEGSLGRLIEPFLWAGGGSDQLATGDLNGDRIPDLVTAGAFSTGDSGANIVTISLGRADGGLEPPSTMTLTDGTNNVIVLRAKIGDWNRDGIPDLLVAERNGVNFGVFRDQLRILLGNGTGQFTPASESPIFLDQVGPNWHNTFVLGDFTGDGLTDILSDGSPREGLATLAVNAKDSFLGYSLAFHIPLPASLERSVNARDIQIGDMNGDSKPDILVGFIGPNRPPIHYYLSTPTGYSDPIVLEYNAISPGPFDLADYTGDGKLDVAIIHSEVSNFQMIADGDVLSIVAGDGTGKFNVVLQQGFNRRGFLLVGAADTDGDGDRDLIVSAGKGQFDGFTPIVEDSFVVLENPGVVGKDFVLGRFSPLAPSGISGIIDLISITDVNADGKPDFYFRARDVALFGTAINDGAGEYQVGPGPSLGIPSTSPNFAEPGFVRGDFNVDGFSDFVRIAGENGIDIYLGTANGGFRLHRSLPISTRYVRVGDMNNDGFPDLVARAERQNEVPAVFLGDGTGFFKLADVPMVTIPSSFSTYLTGEIADLNNDGKLDFFATLTTRNSAAITSDNPAGYITLFGDGTGKLLPNTNTIFNPGGYGLPPSLFDVTGDGIPDVVVGQSPFTGPTGQTDSRLTVFRGKGNGTFVQHSSVLRTNDSDNSIAFTPGDFNRDGKLDLLGHSLSGSTVYFYRGTGGGQFVPDEALDIPLRITNGEVLVTDVTGDDVSDLVVSDGSNSFSTNTGSVIVFPGSVSGRFGAGQQIPVGGLFPGSLLALPRDGTFEAGSFTITAPVFAPPPTTGNLTVTTSQGRSVGVDVRPAFSGVTNSPLVVSIASNPANGTVRVDANGTPADLSDDLLRYDPRPNFVGTDSFEYLIADGSGGQVTARISVNVQPGPTTPPPPPGQNTPPTISVIGIVTTRPGVPTSPIAYTIGDDRTPLDQLAITVFSNNTDIVPDSAIIQGGSGANRTLTITPRAGTTGEVVIFINVSDGEFTEPRSFALRIDPTAPPPPPLPPPPPRPGSLAREFLVGSGDSGAVKFYNPDGSLRSSADVFPGFTGGVRTAAADFNRDGIADLVIGTGPGRATRVIILDGANTSRELFRVDPFEPSFTGGVYVSAGDVTGDGVADLAITPDEGGGPRVDLYRGGDFVKIIGFFGIDDINFRGGARAAIGEMTGDGMADLIVVAGFGGGPRVAGFDGTSLTSTPRKIFGDFFAFEQTLRNGIFVTVGDLNGDGFAELICGGGPGGGPRVLAFDGQKLLSNQYVTVANFFGGNLNSRGGIRLAVKNLDNDDRDDLVVGAGSGDGSLITAYFGRMIGPTGTPATAFDFETYVGTTDGVFVG